MRSTENEDEFTRPVFVNEQDNLADLISRMPEEARQEFQKLGHTYTTAAVIDRKCLIVQTMGKREGRPRPPKMLGIVRIIGFSATSGGGCTATVQDEATGKTLQVGHVPTRLFGFPVFISVPIYQGLKWEAKELRDGSYRRSLVFGLCFKQQSAIKWLNRDNVAVLMPNEYRDIFGT
jgi:hypothetical protein